MIGHYVLAGTTIFLIFMLFLVISRTMNNTINLLVKLNYLLQKEFDLKKEALEVRKMMEEQMNVQSEKLQSSPLLNPVERTTDQK